MSAQCWNLTANRLLFFPHCGMRRHGAHARTYRAGRG
jgi:hypothetical protein